MRAKLIHKLPSWVTLINHLGKKLNYECEDGNDKLVSDAGVDTSGQQISHSYRIISFIFFR